MVNETQCSFRGSYAAVHDSQIFFFFLICPKNWENWEKIGFFKLTENLVINFSEFGV